MTSLRALSLGMVSRAAEAPSLEAELLGSTWEVSVMSWWWYWGVESINLLLQSSSP